MNRYALRSFGAALLVCAALALPSPVAAAQADAAPKQEASIASINGFAWMDSSPDVKLAFLLGVESAVAMEYSLANAQAEKTGKKPVHSRFEEGWRAAFKDVTRHQIMGRLDAYYTAHPAEKSRHVFDVLWKEMILPGLSQGGK